jgi:predicted  nucleic acid-binding Zn-ribbon protein
MLEDIDHLAERIAQLVAHTKAQQAEHQALRDLLALTQAERDQLRAKLDGQGETTRVLSGKLSSYESEIEGLRAQSQAKQVALQGSLDLFKQEHATLQAQLQSRDKEVTRLRAVTESAKERIEAVLERLPGATLEGQK